MLAILGVVALPVTSGDTAFRAARLTIAEMFNFKQSAIPARLAIAIPIFAIGVVLNFVDFNVIWRYFGFANQALAAIMLWASGAYLYRKHRLHWICTVPATFMTAVCISYICYEPKMGFGMGIEIADIIGVIAASTKCSAHRSIATHKGRDLPCPFFVPTVRRARPDRPALRRALRQRITLLSGRLCPTAVRPPSQNRRYPCAPPTS